MRKTHAQEARLRMAPDEDDRALGGAVTVALCGSWEHVPPCPLAPHHSSTRRDGDVVRLRVLFAVDDGREAEVRARIVSALSRGRQRTPEGATARWRLLDSIASDVLPDELAHAQRLADG